MHPRSVFSLAEHLERLSKDGDPLEVLAETVEFERFRPLLTRGLGYSDGTRGGRPTFDLGAMFKVLVVQLFTLPGNRERFARLLSLRFGLLQLATRLARTPRLRRTCLVA